MEKVNRLPYQKLISFLEGIGKVKKHYGLKNALYYTSMNLFNRFAEFRVLYCISVQLEDLPKKYLAPDPQFSTAFLDNEELKKYCLPEYDMTESFVTEATKRGDRCLGIFDKDKLASYGWYSVNSTDDTEHLTLSFSRAVYMYKGYVVKAYRGKGLNATGRALALKEYSNIGYNTMLSYIDSINFASLNSSRRLGNKFFGKFFILKLFGRYFTFCTKGCKKYDFKIYQKQA